MERSIEIGPGYWDDESEQTDAEIVSSVNSIVNGSEGIEETAKGAIKLHMFNFFKSHPEATPEEITNELAKINRLSGMEREYGRVGNPLPTIGIEIEIPEDYLTGDKVQVLKKLGIKNYGEYGTNLWEVNPDFSYSPWVASRILQELADMGAVPLENNRVPKTDDAIMSLHINFGMPGGLTPTILQKSKESIQTLSDLITYGFTSPQRIENRKTKSSLYLDKDSRQSKKAGASPRDKSESYLARIEMRANEFRDYPTFRMLAESQRLMAIVMADIKTINGLELTQAESELAPLWPQLYAKACQLFAEHDIVEPGIVDKQPRSVIEVLGNPEFVKNCREIITKYALKAGNIIERHAGTQAEVAA